MVLNPALYAVLLRNFGEVRISNEGIERIEERRDGETHVIAAGEAYNVCCPICGDERFRLSVSYKWLEYKAFSRSLIVGLINCYNEQCRVVRRPEFYEPFLQELRLARINPELFADNVILTQPRRRSQNHAIPMPNGCVPLDSLSDTHPAMQFLRSRYKVSPYYLSKAYGASFTDVYDERFPAAMDRVVFPIFLNGKQVAWQGRAISSDAIPRWFLPPGFVKCFYNGDNVAPLEIPLINEGIMNAICCGPNGVAIFGKQLNTLRCEDYAKKWNAAIIALDPDTFVPNNRKGGHGRVYAKELRDQLSDHVSDIRMLPWPKEILEIARRHNNGEDIPVPDAAELGPKYMQKVIKEVL